MKKLNPQNVFVQYRDRMRPYESVMNRKYTITYSDTTAQLFVFVAENYAEDQITSMRDEVRITWNKNKKGLTLIGSVMVSGKGIKGNPFMRNKIFYNELPIALQALRHADRFLFEITPNLDNTQVLIHFISTDPIYDKIYDFGVIGNYK